MNQIIDSLENGIYSGSDFSQVRNESLYQEIVGQIDKLMTNEYDWDDIGYEKPYKIDIDYAKRVMLDFVANIDLAGYSLDSLAAPFISNSEFGGATIEWRESERSLYLDIKHQNSSYTKVWKEGKNTIVRTDELHKSEYVNVWKWIINE